MLTRVTSQVWSSRSHDFERGCICRDNYGHQMVDPACPVKGHTSWVSSVAFFPDGERIVSGSSDMRFKIWDAASGAQVFSAESAFL